MNDSAPAGLGAHEQGVHGARIVALTQTAHDGHPLSAYELTSPAGVQVRFVPGAGMVGASMHYQGQEVLGLRGGLESYLSDAKTFGIPLLAPWANRLGSDHYRVDDIDVEVTGVPGVHRDSNGLPIHGLLAAAWQWQVDDFRGENDSARLVAHLDFNDQLPQFAGFPFPHTVSVEVVLRERTVAVTTTITAHGERPVPVAFGWHPYLAIPGVDRDRWQLHVPFTTEVVLDSRSLPTGQVRQIEPFAGPLADRSFDDLYAGVTAGQSAWVEGNGLRLSMTYTSGYPYAVVYAPPGDNLVALEPMTAPTDPFAGHFDIRYAAPGGAYSATFEVGIDDVDREDNR